MKGFVAFAGIAFSLIAANSVQATTLLTSADGYAGPKFTIPAFYGDPNNFIYFTGPLALGNGVTLTSNAPLQSDIGVIANSGYLMNANGSIYNAPYIGLDDAYSTMTLTFADPVSSFGMGMNYALNFDGTITGDDPVISAYDANNALIASYDLFQLAPISTPEGIDQFQFRGISSTGPLISSFRMSGAFIVGQAALAVPEPATWVLMLAGLGAMTVVARRRWSGPSA